MFWTWLLLILCGGLAIANIARGLLAIVVGGVLTQTSLPFWLLGSIYLVWGGLFFACVVAVARHLRRARQLVLGCALAYQITMWVIHVVGDVSSYARRLWIRDLIVSLLFLLVVVVLTHLPVRENESQSR